MKALLTPGELAERLRVSKQQVYNLTHRKAIPVKKVGRLLRFDSDEIETWLASGGLP